MALKPRSAPEDRPEPFEWLPPFNLQTVQFLVATGEERLPPELREVLERVLKEEEGYLEEPRDQEPPLRIPGLDDKPYLLVSARLPKVDEVKLEEAFERLARIAGALREQGVGGVIVQPDWYLGATMPPVIGAGGIGAGPGTRPEPEKGGSRSRVDPLVQKLRRAKPDERHSLRLVFLDSWNGDRSETSGKVRDTLLRALNDHALGEPFDVANYFASRDPDPFPMPDHGLFAASLTMRLLGRTLCLSNRMSGHLAAKSRRALGGRAEQSASCIALESYRVLDEHGVGTAERLYRTLIQIGESIGKNENVVVNMSLIVNIPVFGRLLVEVERLLAGSWPGQEGGEQRMDFALESLIRWLQGKGVLLVASAGNDSQGESRRRTPARFPAAYPGVLDVTAAADKVDRNGVGKEAYYANEATEEGIALFAGDCDAAGNLIGRRLHGPFSDHLVPVIGRGRDPENQSGVVSWAGTSFAAPLATGLAALIWRADGTLTPSEVAARLRKLANARLAGSGTPYIRLTAP